MFGIISLMVSVNNNKKNNLIIREAKVCGMTAVD
jgi:hypothetical protein